MLAGCTFVITAVLCCLVGSCLAWLPNARSGHQFNSRTRLDYAGTDKFESEGTKDMDKVTLSTFADGPVLKVVDRESNCTVHLIGVSHGSPASSELVSRVMQQVSPARVVVELCEDRFVSISLDAAIRPRMNATLERIYDEKLKLLKERKGQGGVALADGDIPLLTRLRNAWDFAKQQGPVGGIFVVLGLTVSALQKYTRVSSGAGIRGTSSRDDEDTSTSTVCDEFVTAMKEAEQLQIPVVLGDAPQNDTLDSIKRVLSPELIYPAAVAEGALFLAFSALGVGARKSYEALASTIDDEALQGSEWVNIPRIYTSGAMLRSLGPLLALAALTASLGYLPELADALGWGVGTSAGTVTDTFSSGTASSAEASTFGEMVNSAQSLEAPRWLQAASDVAADIFSFLLLVRMGKLIGTDRDKIIATKVREAARESPDKDIVVVIGMLHCNGVGRWLLSGQEPAEFEKIHGVR